MHPHSLANMQRGQQLNVTHGGFAFLNSHVLQCSRCVLSRSGCTGMEIGADTCPVLARYRGEVEAMLAAMPHLTPMDAPLCQLLILSLEECWYLGHAIRTTGLLRATGDGDLGVRTVHRAYAAARRDCERLLRELALSPVQRARLMTGMVQATSWAARVFSTDTPAPARAELIEQGDGSSDGRDRECEAGGRG